MPWYYTAAKCGPLSVRTVSGMPYAETYVSIYADATVSVEASHRGIALVNLVNQSQMTRTC